MKKISILSLLAIISISTCLASDFCDGFEEGYKTVKGDMVMVPMCPMEPLTPMGSTPHREGVKAGIKKAGGL